MKSMYKHWGLHISTNVNHLEVVLGSFWAVWRGLLLSLEPKLRSWQFPRYWWFNKQYHSGYLLICLISWPLLIALRHDWYQSKGLFKVFWVPLRPWESSKNWWRYGQMKFVTPKQDKKAYQWELYSTQAQNSLSFLCHSSCSTYSLSQKSNY